jgi:hypothetical protein
MGTAIELFGAVYTTDGGTRYHADRECPGLNGRFLHYEPRRRSTISAAQFSYTACLVCVPAADALPPLPFVGPGTFGHEPVLGFLADRAGERTVCGRCETRQVRSYVTEPYLNVRRWVRRSPVPWPCTSAAVLGLVVIDADRWNARYPVGTPVAAYPWVRADEPLRTRTRTPAWRLGHGDSVVSVDGHAGGIHLTHVDPL